jgi:glycosyltransferase involved in cell wall biosynthesis
MKAQSSFLAAAAQLKQTGCKVKFVLVGLNESWTNKPLVADIDKHQLRGDISLLGLRQDVSRIMAGLDCLVSTSTSEGFPNVIGEAMACGVPCVATDAGDSRLIVGDTGKILPIGDVAGVVDGVLQLMDAGPDDRARRSVMCRERIANHFQLGHIAERYAEFYRELEERRTVRDSATARPARAVVAPDSTALPPLRIACMMSALNAGGAERVTVELASLFAKGGHDVTLFVGWPSVAEAPPRSRLHKNVRIEYMLPVWRGTAARYLGGISWALRNRRRLCAFDLVHCHLTFGAFVGTVISMYRRAAGLRTPAIVETYHAVGMRISPRLRWLHARMAAHRDVLVLMASDAYWSRFTNRHQGLTVRTVLNGTSTPDVCEMTPADRAEYRTALGIPESCKYVIGSVGFLRSDRQPEVFVPIIARLVHEFGDNVHWIFGGDGPEQANLENLVKEAGIQKNVHFAGYIADVKYPLSIIDLYFTLSVGPVTGVAALEATLVGLPVIGVQLLHDYKPAASEWIWSSYDARTVAEKAIHMLNNPAQRRQLGERQQAYARVHHSVEAMGRSYQEIYKLALAQTAWNGAAASLTSPQSRTR